MDKLNKTEVVLDAIERMKAGAFGLTAIKVELEAELGRSDLAGDQCEDDCVDDCYRCADTSFHDPDDVDYGGDRFGSDQACRQHILKVLEPLGLSELDGGRWVAKKPLVFAKFYNDGSVDSEFTFTLLMNKPENALLLPKIIQAFRSLAGEIDHNFDISGAGMHVALINKASGHYNNTDSPTTLEASRFRNFRKSMKLLLPALYFLASTDGVSRQLEYRQPRIDYHDGSNWQGAFYDNPKYGAISYRGRALEFRLFETCYGKPEAILDHLVVMKNCLRYWRKTYKDPHITVARGVSFGCEGNENLDRLYVTTAHVDLLNAGIRKLKPSYYSIRQLKQQRGFRVTKNTINNGLGNVRKLARISYKEYEERFRWRIEARRHSLLAEAMYDHDTSVTDSNRAGVLLAEISSNVERHIAQEAERDKQSIDHYVTEQVERFLSRRNQGVYQLT